MKRLVFAAVLTMMLGFSTLVNAALVNNGGGLIYDTDLNITWYDAPQDQGYVSPGVRNFGWYQATSWASSLTLGGTTAGSWRLPTTPGTGYGYTNEGEMGHLYYDELHNLATGPLSNTGPFVNLGPTTAYFYWSSTGHAEPGAWDDGAWGFFFADGYQSAGPKTIADVYALAVHDGNIGAPVPIPAAAWLLGSGLLGLVGIRRKISK